VIAAQRDRITAAEDGLDIVLDRPLPGSLPVGKATAVFCVGTCFDRHRHIADMAIIVDGIRHRPTAQRMPRPDRFRELHPTLPPEEAGSADEDRDSPRDPELRSYRSGFWATIPIGPYARAGNAELSVEARLADGTRACTSLGKIPIVGRTGTPPCRAVPESTQKPLIAICMATYNPNIELFRAQVESIRAQTDRSWICLISDDCSEPDRFDAIANAVAGDERFVLSRADQHLSFYRNFERALQMAPQDAEFIALCDQDDRWYRDKLVALRRAIGPAELAYSDLRRVEASGRVRAETSWEGRRNNNTNLASLLISNTITGAACLFHRRVIDFALPFPDGPGWDFHDHWLALMAMALGDVAYVDRPLYDYVQHPGAVLGRVAGDQPRSTGPKRVGFRARLARRRGFLERWRSAYFRAYLQRELLARVLLARCGTGLAPRKRRALRLMVAAGRSPLAFAWLAVRPARALLGRNETLGVELVLARGILWRHLIALRTRGRERPGRSSYDSSMASPVAQSVARPRRWLARS
jgi:glycosyltransferase involved in cell wall biosynthesis